MIHEEPNPDFNAIAKDQEKHDQHRGYIHSCGHSKFFWNKFKKVDFGDIILCSICHQYFAKIKNIPWVVKRDKRHAFGKAHSNHLGDGHVKISGAYAFRVNCRVTT